MFNRNVLAHLIVLTAIALVGLSTPTVLSQAPGAAPTDQLTPPNPSAYALQAKLSAGAKFSPEVEQAVGPQMLEDYQDAKVLFWQSIASGRRVDLESAMRKGNALIAAAEALQQKHPEKALLIKQFVLYPLIWRANGTSLLGGNAQPLYSQIQESYKREMVPHDQAYVLLEQGRDLIRNCPAQPEKDHHAALKRGLDLLNKASTLELHPIQAYHIAFIRAQANRRFTFDNGQPYLATAATKVRAAAAVAQNKPADPMAKKNLAQSKKELDEIIAHAKEAQKLYRDCVEILDASNIRLLQALDPSGSERLKALTTISQIQTDLLDVELQEWREKEKQKEEKEKQEKKKK